MNFDLVVRKVLVAMAWLSLVQAVGGAARLGPASQWSGDDHANRTLRRSRTCVENQQYLHQGLCCLNCRAGTYVQKACEHELGEGLCLPCRHGETYTEHSNGMNRCLPCTHCRSDEMETHTCTSTTDTKCQCRSGTFCVPDQACEVCKRCAKCKAGEEEEKKCTSFSNTVCRKRLPSTTDAAQPLLPTAAPSRPEIIVIPILFILALIIGLGLLFRFRRHFSCERPCSKTLCESGEIVKIPIDESGATAEERQNDQNAGLEGGDDLRPESRPLLQETQAGVSKPCSPVEDEDRGLGDSLPNTTSSSQTSLSALPTITASPSSSSSSSSSSSRSSPHPSPTPAQTLHPTVMSDPLQKRLLPLLGSEKSLRKSFDLFDEYLDVRIHNRFFRLIGVSDNHIRLAESTPPGDKVYDLLKSWMQREGLKADINNLLDALLSMDQRRSAESIACAALQKGYYKHADAP